MNRWLVDASVLLASEDPHDANRDDARRLLRTADEVATLDLALYETANVAITSWHDPAAAELLGARIAAIAADDSLVCGDPDLVTSASAIALEHGISVYDAAYVAASRARYAELVSCDVRDLVSKGLARLPSAALS